MGLAGNKDGNRANAWRLLFWIYLALFLYGFLLFHGDESRNRVLNEIWDLGHVAGFLSLTFFLYKLSRSFVLLPCKIQLIVAILATLLIGFAIETIQLYTGRSFSINDVYLDLVGTTSGVVLFSVCVKLSRPTIRWLLRFLVGLSFLIVSADLILFSIDALYARQQFPKIIACEHASELTRFSGARVNVGFAEIDRQQVVQTKFLPARYSTLTLDHFPRDWTAYKFVVIEIYNPGKATLELHIRIHDILHFQNSRHSDRYNYTHSLLPGWNTIHIPLSDVRKAPAEREMDMQRIHQLIFFFHKLQENTIIYIRKVALET